MIDQQPDSFRAAHNRSSHCAPLIYALDESGGRDDLDADRFRPRLQLRPCHVRKAAPEPIEAIGIQLVTIMVQSCVI